MCKHAYIYITFSYTILGYMYLKIFETYEWEKNT